MSRDKRKDYCVTFKRAVIDVEVLDCINEHEAIAYAENKIKELDFDFELEAYQCGGHGFEEQEETGISNASMIVELLDKFHEDDFADLLIEIKKHMEEQKETRGDNDN